MPGVNHLEDTAMASAEKKCQYCEKYVLELELHKEIDMLLELPNTFDHLTKKYEWRDTGLIAYTLMPRSIHGTHGIIDVYVCADEDDFDDLDLGEYLKSFLTHDILPSWGNLKNLQLSGPFLSPPVDIGCWRMKQ